MKTTFTGLELANMDMGEFSRRIGELALRSGTAHVASGRLEEVRHPDKDVIEVHAYFDSSYWTGRGFGA